MNKFFIIIYFLSRYRLVFACKDAILRVFFPRLKPGVSFFILTPDFSLGNRRISCVSNFGNPERFAKEQTSNVQCLKSNV
mgnify:CR=1 FL=1